MITKVKQFMDQFHMVNTDDEIIVGLSGGADSVCLLFLLKELSEGLGFSLEAVHINHGLRKESEEEAVFVEKLCKKAGVICHFHALDVKTYAAQHGLGIEEAARSLRYEVFETYAESGDKKRKIALAHHQDDQAETVLFHLIRGSGLRGMTGMRPVRDCFIRPLLCISRQEIEAYLGDKELPFVTDESNYDTVYARNKIRHEILPKAEQISPGAAEHIATQARITAEALDFLDAYCAEVYKNLVTESADVSGNKTCKADKAVLAALPAYPRSAVIYEMLAAVCGKRKDLSKTHVDAVVSLVSGQSGKRLDLIHGIKVLAEQETLFVYRDTGVKAGASEETVLALNKTTEFFAGGERWQFVCRVFSYEKKATIPDKPYTKWFDYDKINSCPVVRNRKSGDYFYCSDTAKKKLQDYFINEKIPVSERDQKPLVADGNHILWIAGGRISSYYKISDKTKQVLEITIHRGEENER